MILHKTAIVDGLSMFYREAGTPGAPNYTGEPGDGFVEDPNTFHRAMQPISSARLVLLVRYS